MRSTSCCVITVVGGSVVAGVVGGGVGGTLIKQLVSISPHDTIIHR